MVVARLDVTDALDTVEREDAWLEVKLSNVLADVGVTGLLG